jgi:guanylate kinase
MVGEGLFFEWAQVHDNFYGTSIEAFKKGIVLKRVTLVVVLSIA